MAWPKVWGLDSPHMFIEAKRKPRTVSLRLDFRLCPVGDGLGIPKTGPDPNPSHETTEP